jgi:hypothetical protein
VCASLPASVAVGLQLPSHHGVLTSEGVLEHSRRLHSKDGVVLDQRLLPRFGDDGVDEFGRAGRADVELPTSTRSSSISP